MFTLLLLYRREQFLAPWDLEKCRAKCYEQGQQIPWGGGENIPWRDPAQYHPTFDVAGCMARCDKSTWYES